MTQAKTQLPNFIIFGSTKSGSTSLCNYIVQHPDIFISRKKEPNFFLHDEGSPIVDSRKKMAAYTLDWYQYWFRKADEKAIGEASVSYLANEKAPMRIKSMIPDVKLIAILREPVSRAYSHYLFNKRNNREDAENLLSAITNDKKLGSPQKYFERGLYFHYLKNYFELFDNQNIKIFLFEDFTSNSLKVVQEVFTFLDVDNNFIPVLGAKDAASGIPRNRELYKFIHKDNSIKKALRPLVRMLFPEAQKRRTLWTQVVDMNLSRPPLDTDTKQVLSEMYKPDILQLQKLINRDLSKWFSDVSEVTKQYED